MYRGTLASFFILIYLNCFLVESKTVQNGMEGWSINGMVIYDITSIIREAWGSGYYDGMVSSLQNILHEEHIGVHFDAGTEINELSQLLTVVQRIKKVAPRKKLFISLRDPITFSIPDLETTMPAGLYALIFPISCGGNSNLENGSRALISSLHSSEILIGFRNPNSSCLLSKAVVEEADLVFNVVNFTIQVGFPESYTIFRNHLQSIVKHEEKKGSFSFNFHLRLESFSEGTSFETDLEYNLLFSQFGKRWSKESSSLVILQMSSTAVFPNLGGTQRFKRSVSRRSMIIPWIGLNLPVTYSPAFILESLNALSLIHEKIQLSIDHLEGIASSIDHLEAQAKLSNPLNVTVWVGGPYESSFKAVSLQDKIRNRNIFLDTLDYEHNLVSQKPSWFDGVVRETPTVCGYSSASSDLSVPPSTVVQKAREGCGFLFDQATCIEWFWRFDYTKAEKENFSLEFYNRHVQQRLSDALLARRELRLVKPNVEMRLRIGYNDFPFKDSTFNFYCNETLLKHNAYMEGIANWGRVNDFPVVIPRISPDFVEDTTKISWWSRVKVSQDISEAITKHMPVYVLRNFPEEFSIANWKVDACVNWSEKVPTRGIPLDKDFSGVSVTMDMWEKTLSFNELETMLLFALHKFKTVELLPRKGTHQLTDLQTLNSLLATDFLDALVDFDILGGKFYLGISMKDTNFTQNCEQIEKIAEKINQGPASGLHLSGLHLTYLENQTTPENVEQLVDMGKKYNFKMGLEVANCAELLNNLAKSLNSSTFPSSDYILCPTKTHLAHNKNKDEFATQFDTHLYMSKIFPKFLPGRALYFRVNSSPCCEGDDEEAQTENLFRFLTDVNQVAVGNQLKHFLVQAFTTTRGSSSSSSWFTVETHTEFSSTSAFRDREKELIDPTLNSSQGFQTTSNSSDLRNQSSYLIFPRKEASFCRNRIPVGLGYSFFQNEEMGVIKNKVFELGKITPSIVTLDVPEGLNVTAKHEQITCFKVFRNRDVFVKEYLKALGLSSSLILVEKFENEFFEEHPCFNLISLREPSSQATWNSMSATVDFIKFSVGLNEGAKLKSEFEQFVSYFYIQHNHSLVFNFLSKTYGTHVVTRADFGGRILIQVKLRQTEDDGVKLSDFEKLAILSKAIGEISKLLKSSTRENITSLASPKVNPRVIYQLSQFGGNLLHYFSSLSEMNSLKKMKDWKESLVQYPVVLTTSLKLLPLDEVVSQYGTNMLPMIAAWIQNALGELYTQNGTEVSGSRIPHAIS